jgi:hypothetical protein
MRESRKRADATVKQSLADSGGWFGSMQGRKTQQSGASRRAQRHWTVIRAASAWLMLREVP